MVPSPSRNATSFPPVKHTLEILLTTRVAVDLDSNSSSAAFSPSTPWSSPPPIVEVVFEHNYISLLLYDQHISHYVDWIKLRDGGNVFRVPEDGQDLAGLDPVLLGFNPG
ncbi:hypothetical protein L218DRAFT_1081753 [Marasmius fiardii PR-910]|nr:hypothetical protein L218DRAFT_1081753 [Marasmius fiardii PR-910]